MIRQAFPETFERETGCTEVEWLRSLPGACRDCPLTLTGTGRGEVQIGAGRLWLAWDVLPPRRIALIAMPRMRVRYRFEAVDGEARSDFMHYFDLYLLRGGG